jgi:hypothetical protein
MSEIYTPTRDELERRISRYGALKEMTTRSKELAGPTILISQLFVSLREVASCRHRWRLTGTKPR